jgi:hypothetical protein
MTFTRKDTPSIMDGMVVRYRQGGAEISASRNGVNIHLTGADAQGTLDTVIEYLRRAFRQYVQLKMVGEPFPEEVFEEPSDFDEHCMCPADGLYPGCPVHGSRSQQRDTGQGFSSMGNRP